MDVEEFGNIVVPCIRIFLPEGCSNRGGFLFDEGSLVGNGLGWHEVQHAVIIREARRTLQARIPLIRAVCCNEYSCSCLLFHHTFEVVVNHACLPSASVCAVETANPSVSDATRQRQEPA